MKCQGFQFHLNYDNFSSTQSQNKLCFLGRQLCSECHLTFFLPKKEKKKTKPQTATNKTKQKKPNRQENPQTNQKHFQGLRGTRHITAQNAGKLSLSKGQLRLTWFLGNGLGKQEWLVSWSVLKTKTPRENGGRGTVGW